VRTALLKLPDVPGQFWTVHWIQGGGKGKDVVIAPDIHGAIAKWLKTRKDGQFFLTAERTKIPNV
jgi:hypothetical protein